MLRCRRALSLPRRGASGKLILCRLAADTMTTRLPAVGWILLCDTALVDLDGRVSAVAITDRLFLRSLPARVPRLTLVARFADSEFDPDWQVQVVVTRPGGSRQVFEDFEDVDVSLDHCIARLTDIGVETVGSYRFDLVIDGLVAGSAALDVALTTVATPHALAEDDDENAFD